MNISPIKSSKNQYMQNFKGGFVKVGNEYINPDKIRKIKSSFKDYGLTDIAVVVNEFGEEKKFENIKASNLASACTKAQAGNCIINVQA